MDTSPAQPQSVPSSTGTCSVLYLIEKDGKDRPVLFKNKKKTDDKTVHDFKNTSIGSVFLFFLLHGFFPGLDELILKYNLQNAKLCLMQ